MVSIKSETSLGESLSITLISDYLVLGLVRGIDMEKKLFYITTPEPLHRIEQVNCLILGKNELPSGLYTCSKVSSRLYTHYLLYPPTTEEMQ